MILTSSAYCQKYFEGMVEYETSFQSFNSAITDSELKERFGVKVRFYHKDGDYIREYLDEAGYSLRKFIYKTDSNQLFIIDIFNPDTAYYFNANEKLFDTYQIIKGDNEIILGCDCPSSVITYNFYDRSMNDTIYVKSEYFFCHQLPVNPDYYNNYYLWYDVIKNEKSVALKFTEETIGFFKIIYKAIKIDHVALPKGTFDIDKKLILKRQDMYN